MGDPIENTISEPRKSEKPGNKYTSFLKEFRKLKKEMTYSEKKK